MKVYTLSVFFKIMTSVSGRIRVEKCETRHVNCHGQAVKQ